MDKKWRRLLQGIICFLTFSSGESNLFGFGEDSVTDQPDIPNAAKCNIYGIWRKNGSEIIYKGYEGIPQNLILNLIGWLFLLMLFSILRKKAWNYGRIALLNTNERRARLRVEDKNFTDIFYGSFEGKPEEAIKKRGLMRARGQGGRVQIKHDNRFVSDTGLFSWILTVFKLTDSQFYAKSGVDAVLYLSFQRHLIFLSSIVTLTCITLVLPINIHGGPDGAPIDLGDFKTTTINNMGADSKFLWVHVALSIGFLFLSIIVMRHFSRALITIYNDPTILQTVMITGISKRFCDETIIKSHFEEIYPDVEIHEINFAYDISNLQKIEEKRISSESALNSCNTYLNKHQLRPTMKPYACGIICCCCQSCFCCKSTDAVNFYTERVVKYTIESTLERRKALTHPIGIAFVTFSTKFMAERAVEDYRGMAKLFNQAPKSKFSRNIKSGNWIVKFAPLPEELYWEHLSLRYNLWYAKAITVNLFVVILVCFFTTPVILLNSLNKYLFIIKSDNGTANSTIDDGIESSTDYSTNISNFGNSTKTLRAEGTFLAGLIADTLPTILLLSAAVALPSLVVVTDKMIGFWTKTAENRSRMLKSFTFLLFMVIILPSVGVQSITAVWQKGDVNWNCIFFASNAAFFINYVTTSSFLGTASELLRLPELFLYALNLLTARSIAEMNFKRKEALWDFQLGAQYAWMMLIFAIFVMFSLIAPLICPFGLVYLILKHYVDRYNLYFAYGPCKVDKEVHGTAVNFVVVCMFLLQAVVLVYTNLISNRGKEEGNKPLQVFSIIGFCITAALFVGQIFFNLFANFSPVIQQNEVRESEELDAGAPGHVGTSDGDHNLDDEDHGQGVRRRSSKGRYFPQLLHTPMSTNVKAGVVSSPIEDIDELSEGDVEEEMMTSAEDVEDPEAKSNPPTIMDSMGNHISEVESNCVIETEVHLDIK